MKILHTSDWHLGHALCGKGRGDEFEAFLNWLVATIRDREVEALLVSGDVFDNGAPSHRAQALYYRFLCDVAATPCRHVVVIAGNHDSPTFLDAPRDVLRALRVHVIGQPGTLHAAAGHRDRLEGEVLVLEGADGAPELIACAVPYLRDRDVRLSEAGERVEDKERNLVTGIREHYARVARIAERRRQEIGAEVPIVALGHLFTAGGWTSDGDGVRDLYVGSLAQMPASAFPECFGYVALGHLHAPQRVGGSDRIRYSGAPLVMGFGEVGRRKSVCLVEIGTGPLSVEEICVPTFQRLARVKGDWDGIARQLEALAALGEATWLEVTYEGEAIVGDLRERVEAAVAGTRLEVLKIVNSRLMARVMARAFEGESLDDLSEEDVFERCLALKAKGAPEDQIASLWQTYREALSIARGARAASAVDVEVKAGGAP